MFNFKSLKISSLFLLLIIVFLVSCDPTKQFYERENEEIQDFISSNPTLTFTKMQSGLYYMEVQAGTGSLATKNDTAYLKYTGKFLDGSVIETNVGTPDTLIRPVGNGWFIPGLEEAVTYLKVGTKAMVLIPSKLAYGPGGYYGIPGFTPLLFDLELVKLKILPDK